MNAYFADVAGFLKSHMGPGFARIDRFIDSISIGNINANGGLACACIDHVGIALQKQLSAPIVADLKNPSEMHSQ